MYCQFNISRFKRMLRNDPFYGIYTYKFYFGNDKADATETREWLEERYQRWEGHQYHIIYYASTDGNLYAHCVYMQTISPNDLLYAKMRCNLSDLSVQRGDRTKVTRKQTKPRSPASATTPQFTPSEAEVERAVLAS